MAIKVKNAREIELMREANRLTGELLNYIETLVKPGITTGYLDKKATEFIDKLGCKGGFLGYGGFPGVLCTSLNDVVVHGIPRDNVYLEEGDIISIDTGVLYKGYNGDAARTFPVGKISADKQKLIDVTKQSFFEGISILKSGIRVGDLGSVIQRYAEKNGYSVVRELTGHGIGANLHEDPSIPNYGVEGRGPRLLSNMTIAIEPMINMGRKEIYQDVDGWTIRTADGCPSAHYENTVLITDEGCEILSLV